MRNVDRLAKKWLTIQKEIYPPEITINDKGSKKGLIFFGTSSYAAIEAIDLLAENGLHFNAMRLKAFPFTKEVHEFIDNHDEIYVIEQNRDAQCRTILITELNINPSKLKSVLNYDGFPITAQFISEKIITNR